jgi:ABC-type Co2+ transport system permease subunit
MWTHIADIVAHIAQVVSHWPWSTIAAFAAAAAALWVARAETRERKQLLGREAVVDVVAMTFNWHSVFMNHVLLGRTMDLS